THDIFKHPEWMIEYGGKLYYDPALPEVQTHLTKVVKEVVDKYDIDAIHFDDYFYPYAVPGKVFNDTASFKKIRFWFNPCRLASCECEQFCAHYFYNYKSE
ncbi:family 10 glycosylhydrolase, partial [Flavobacterium sp. LBUM151]